MCCPFWHLPGLRIFCPLFGLSPALVYALKTCAVLACLILVWPGIRHEITPVLDVNAVLVGMAAFGVWVGLEGLYPMVGTPAGFNPWEAGAAREMVPVLMAVRLAGACLVVPVIEEVFWRSFALKFLIDANISRVPLGTFTWFSFVGVSTAFGMEHHRWLPGIITGVLYAMLVYQRKNLFSPILAHAVTNLLLGIYVIVNQAWFFW
jgi:CAAX prenyl protease-like protein